MPDKYGVEQDPYCYPSTSVLRNLLDIQSEGELDEAELELTSFRLENFTPDFSQIDLNYLKYIHFWLFQDIYPWAGELRTVDISKGDTRFCTTSRIERESVKLFSQLEKNQYLTGLELSAFIDSLADFFCELNVIHPFREGNGRASRLLCELLVLKAGFEIRWNDVSRDKWLQANIQGYLGDLQPLIEIFSCCVNEVKG